MSPPSAAPDKFRRVSGGVRGPRWAEESDLASTTAPHCRRTASGLMPPASRRANGCRAPPRGAFPGGVPGDSNRRDALSRRAIAAGSRREIEMTIALRVARRAGALAGIVGQGCSAGNPPGRAPSALAPARNLFVPDSVSSFRGGGRDAQLRKCGFANDRKWDAAVSHPDASLQAAIEKSRLRAESARGTNSAKPVPARMR